MTTLQDKFRGCLIGLAVGDAVGATNEFKSRSMCNVGGMEGGGCWGLRPGDWTDDTSMAFALGASLVERGGFDPAAVMTAWAEWYQGRNYCGSHGRGCFDIGGTTRKALSDFLRTGDPWQGQTSDWSAANGCLMRFAPCALLGYGMSVADRRKLAADVCRLTHGHPLCVAASVLYGDLLQMLLTGGVVPYDVDTLPPELRVVVDRRAWGDPDSGRIKSTGYVVDTLEAAMWASQTRGERDDYFRNAILRAANLGGDADTVAAVAGQLAGAAVGYSAIPAEWLDVLDRRDDLLEVADGLYELATAPLPGHVVEVGESGA